MRLRPVLRPGGSPPNPEFAAISADLLDPEASAAFVRHGGALDAARRAFTAAPRPWIDLSTGINPWPYPIGALPAAAWARLPDEAALAALEAVAARRYRCAAGAVVVAAPGTQAVIARLPAILGGGDVRLLGRTYGGFAQAFAGAGIATRTVETLDALAGADVAVVVNPNNPDGRLVPPATLAALASRVGALVVDEAFADALAPSASVVPVLAAPRAVVLRSFGKVYGLAGLRLGFALAQPAMAARLRDSLGAWPVSGPAIAVGTEALGDDAWIAATRTALPLAAARLDACLSAAGFAILGGTPLFRLAAHRHAVALFGRLARAGILTRPFAERPDRLRLGLPADEAEWARLAAALA